MISALLAAVLALSMTACGKGGSGSDQNETGSGAASAESTDCVYSSEQIVIDDEDGILTDLNIDSLAYRDGRLYATGSSYGYDDAGSHVLMNFAPDGSDFQYTLLMGGSLEDVISMSIGEDGNYYIARVSYDSDSGGFTGTEENAEQPGGEVPTEEGPADTTAAAPVEETAADEAPAQDAGDAGNDAQGPAGAEEVDFAEEGPESAYVEEAAEAGPESAYEEGAGAGPESAYVEEGEEGEVMNPDDIIDEEDYQGDPGGEMEEFVTNGEDSPENDPAMQEDPTEGITSPTDEFPDDPEVSDGEEELTVTEVEEVDPSEAAGSGEAVYVLTCMSPEGQELWTSQVKASGAADAEFYVNDIACSSNGIVVSTSTGLDLYSLTDGSFVKSISTDDKVKSATPYVLNDGTVMILSYGSGGEEIVAIDMETGGLGESYTIPAEVGATFLFPGEAYQMYLGGTNGIYGMNFDGSDVVKIVDYVDSDMDITALTGLVEMEDGKMAAIVADLAGNNMLVSLTKVDPEVVANRKTITLGSYYLDYEVRKQVFAFNKQSQDVRISIEDYSKYDGETGAEGLTKLNTDIVSGSAPDIMVLSPVMPVKSYISKGVFEDLAPYMEKDEEISGREYLTNVLDAFKQDGKMYMVIPSFYVNTVVGKTEDIGDGSGLTLDLVDQLAAQKGVDLALIFGTATRDDVLYAAMELCGSQFIDWEKSECKFDSTEFIRLLEFIKQFPAKIEDTGTEVDTTSYYRSGKALLTRESIGSFDEYVNLRYGVFGTDITMAGFPSQTPGTATIFPQLEIAVNASSEQKDACWSFVRRFLLDEYQSTVEMYWPVSINALDEMANKAMEPLYYTDENGNRVEDHIIMNIGGENIELPRISDTEVDQLYAFLKGLTSQAYIDSSVENIIIEESAGFFEGQKTAEDVAGVIQSRVQIYINENS